MCLVCQIVRVNGVVERFLNMGNHGFCEIEGKDLSAPLCRRTGVVGGTEAWGVGAVPVDVCPLRSGFGEDMRAKVMTGVVCLLSSGVTERRGRDRGGGWKGSSVGVIEEGMSDGANATEVVHGKGDDDCVVVKEFADDVMGGDSGGGSAVELGAFTALMCLGESGWSVSGGQGSSWNGGNGDVDSDCRLRRES